MKLENEAWLITYNLSCHTEEFVWSFCLKLVGESLSRQAAYFDFNSLGKKPHWMKYKPSQSIGVITAV